MKTYKGPRRKRNWIDRLLGHVAGLRREEGSALMEFAVTLPVFMSVITGTASFSLAFYSFEQLGNATANAVQQVAADEGISTYSDPCSTAKSAVTTALPNWTVANFSFTMVITDSSGTTHSYSSTGTTFSCTAGFSQLAPNEPVVLTVQYTYNWLPILAFSPSSPLKSTQAAVAD